MANNDGSIRIKAVINDEKAKKQLDQLESKMRRQTEQVNKQTAAVRRLEEQFQQLASGEKEPQSVKRMAADLKKAEEEAARLDEQFQKLNAIASVDRQVHGRADPEIEAKLADLSEQMAQADARADLLRRRLAEVQMDPSASDEAKKLASDLALASDKLKRMKLEADSTQQSINELSSSSSGRFGQISAVLGTIGQKIRKGFAGAVNLAGKAIEKVRSGIRKLGKEKGFDKAGKAANRFGNRLKSIVAGALFFNLISRGLTALTKQIGTYLTANREFSNALADVKSNLLTAFQPIYDTILPAMTKLMQHMERFTAILAKISAAAFGTTAKKAQENAKALKEQADATEEAGKEAKKAEKYLASFDTIEKLGKEEEEEKPAEPEFDTDFEDVEIPSWLKDFWQPFKDSWEELGASTIQAVKDALGAVWDMLKAIAQTFLDIWKSGAGLEFLNLLQQAFQTILGIIGDIARAFTEAWNSGAGEAVINALFFMLNSILRLIISIGEAFRTAWNDGSGVQIMTTLLNILANIMNIVGELATRLREAWEANGNGVAIWSAILASVQAVLNVIRDLTAATLIWAQNLNLEPLMASIRNVLDSVPGLISAIGSVVLDLWNNTVLPFLSWLLESGLPGVLDKVAAIFDYIAENPETIIKLTETVATFIAAWKLGGIIASIVQAAAGLMTLTTAFTGSATASGLLLGKISLITGAIALILIEIGKLAATDPEFAAVLGDAFESLKNLLSSVINLFSELWPIIQPIAEFIGSFFAGAVQALAAALEIVCDILAFFIDLLSAAVEGVKTLNNWLNGTGANNAVYQSSVQGRSVQAVDVSSYNLPHLANGAVISPNNEFLAVLGDQRSGTNVEAPLDMIKQAVRDVYGEIGAGAGGTNVNVEFNGSLAALGRMLLPVIRTEEQRRGPMIGGDLV
ncbi:hypothetical protein [uncultured Dysosmobacter sp.]|uniref:hypothetical protein n=1 Tax=uncultured Dysosmobacter sp. TaxID=2591384 RepID=UPI00260FE852|nr:hypothetical protein [uncultured Dysosmobacter sp.]